VYRVRIATERLDRSAPAPDEVCTHLRVLGIVKGRPGKKQYVFMRVPPVRAVGMLSCCDTPDDALGIREPAPAGRLFERAVCVSHRLVNVAQAVCILVLECESHEQEAPTTRRPGFYCCLYLLPPFVCNPWGTARADMHTAAGLQLRIVRVARIRVVGN
jgi:hypothetical protein